MMFFVGVIWKFWKFLQNYKKFQVFRVQGGEEKVGSREEGMGRRRRNVVVLGAGGSVGRNLSLLLKMSPLVSRLSLYDLQNTPGLERDLSHIPTAAEVHGYLPGSLGVCLDGDVDVVVIAAGAPTVIGATSPRGSFLTNAVVLRELVETCALSCPDAFLAVVSNPVNSLVPIAREVLLRNGVYDPKKLVGVTYLDVCRAVSFASEALNADPADAAASNPNPISVPVIGGHSEGTVLPLFSRCPGIERLTPADVERLRWRVRNGCNEAEQAKVSRANSLPFIIALIERALKLIRPFACSRASSPRLSLQPTRYSSLSRTFSGPWMENATLSCRHLLTVTSSATVDFLHARACSERKELSELSALATRATVRRRFWRRACSRC